MRMVLTRRTSLLTVIVLLLVAGYGCSKGQPPVARPAPPAPPGAMDGRTAGSSDVSEPALVPPEPVFEDPMASRSLDELNRDSPLAPVFFLYDSSEIDVDGQQVLTANAELLRRFPAWLVTIEGHCDERGTAEYNLALGERRALSARAYLVSLGIAPERLRTVSYGKEFPFEPGSSEAAWSKNRRAHFVITSQ